MSRLEDMATEFKRGKIRELLARCTEAQREMFDRMYKSVDKIPPSKMNNAYDQCARSVEKNENRRKADG